MQLRSNSTNKTTHTNGGQCAIRSPLWQRLSWLTTTSLFETAARIFARFAAVGQRGLAHEASETSRRCRFEQMESRRLLAADPLLVGAVFIEEDLGSDMHGDTIEITFQGGAAGTQLMELQISGDKNAPGMSVGDVFFDPTEGGWGADHGFAFTIISLQARDPSASVRATVDDGSSLLVLSFERFQAGDKLVLSIDVDEVQSLEDTADLDLLNEGFDPITSGIEFQGSRFTATFSAPHYENASVNAEFRNRFDGNLAGTGLNLPLDDADGKRDRTAGAIGATEQQPLPISISGKVYEERDLDLQIDAGEQGIGGVTLMLWRLDGETYLPTGHSVTTDSQGEYEFGRELGLPPGTYQIRQQQPDGWFSVGAIPGTVSGAAIGQSLADDLDVLSAVALPLGDQQAIDYDFAEAKAARISGHVYHDRNDNGQRDSGEEGIRGVAIQVMPIDTIASQAPITVVTDAAGFYEATALAPGTYQLVETQQPEAYLDGLDAAGTVDGFASGTAVNPGDHIESIFLGGGQVGQDFDFGELRATAIMGQVRLTDTEGNCFIAAASVQPLVGVTVQLLDQQGELLRETVTDGDGRYRFADLHPGTYTVVELTPDGVIDGDEHIGDVEGIRVGLSDGQDTITDIVVRSGQQATEYDFCEHLPSQLSGHVYHDRDNDGHRDTGEEGLPSVSLSLLDENGDEVAVTITSSDGYYEFRGLSAGAYTIIEFQPASWLDGQDRAGTVSGLNRGTAINPGDSVQSIRIGWGEQGVDYDFGEFRYASIEGSVHVTGSDGDCDTPDSPQPPLAGVTILLQDSQGLTILETQTDTTGSYRFEQLLPGNYTVVEQTPAGYFDGADHVGTVDGVATGYLAGNDNITSIQLNSDQQAVNYDFCEHAAASLAGRVYHDQNANGRYDDGETGLADVLLRLTNSRGEIVGQTRTGADGRYAFTGLRADTYRITEAQPNGYLDGMDAPGTIEGGIVGVAADNGDEIGSIALGWGQSGIDYDFGELLAGSLAGRVHADLDGDCLFTPDELPLDGVTIQLLDAAGQVIATTQTAADGRYRFDGLTPGIYTIRELQPDGYFHGGQRAGTGGGDDSLEDMIRDISVNSGQHLVDFDFCETPPASIAGLVHADLDGDCTFDAGEQPLAGVTIQLLNQDGEIIATSATTSDGRYRFDNLRAGTYAIRELQPQGLLQGGARAGSGGGHVDSADLITAITIGAGYDLTDYDFCETPAGSLTGIVHVDLNLDCQADAAEPRLAGVTIRLLDAAGNELATARTDVNGRYHFDDLGPGEYAVAQSQPRDLFSGGQVAGSHGGNDTLENLITEILLPAGQSLVDYNFCERPAGSISGFVFQDGEALVTIDGLPPTNLSQLRDGRKTSDDMPLAGIILELRDGISGDPIEGSQALPGAYPSGPIHTVTDADGYYVFHGLPRGNYAVYEVHPDGYFDGIDTPGTTAGIAINRSEEVDQLLIQRLSTNPDFDAIILIPLGVGVTSEHNNFSEIIVSRSLVPPPQQPPVVTPPSVVVLPPLAPTAAPPLIVMTPPRQGLSFATTGTGGVVDVTWHLSVVDAGAPRGLGDPTHRWEGLVWHQTGFQPPENWPAQGWNHGVWQQQLSSADGRVPVESTRQIRFGIPGAVPVVGDFNGDGVDEIGFYRQGHWFLDLNGNGRWDEEDLWAQLGCDMDLPVTGDWNGDGKTDIGIFGPAWPGDAQALHAESGLPDMQNVTIPVSKPKNMPPGSDEATNGLRLLQRSADGPLRADVIDHVFRYGAGAQIAVTGDWSGDGIQNIGVFRDGRWRLDSDGDGRPSAADRTVNYGQAGDLPIVGDFNGDGIDELGVYRGGQWYVDMDHNETLDAHDELFRLGTAGDVPIVGDFNGDGTDDPSVYREATTDSPAPPRDS